MYKYDLENKQRDGYIYARFENGMYGLVKEEIISHEELKEHIKPTAMNRQESPK